MAGTRDFRKLDASAQAEVRRMAVAMVKAGRTRIEAAAVAGVNRRFVGEWVRAEKQEGAAALQGRKRTPAGGAEDTPIR